MTGRNWEDSLEHNDFEAFNSEDLEQSDFWLEDLEPDNRGQDDLELDIDDDALEHDTLERFEERGHKLARKPPRRRSVAGLLAENQKDYNPAERRKFDDPGLEELHRIGLLYSLEWQLKTGKEATVYVGIGPDGLCAVKLYVDSRVRGFKNDALYRGSRFVGDARVKKAMDGRTDYGISAQNILWVEEEFQQLKALHRAGIPVPRPIHSAGNVILMEFIGNETEAAPRVSDAQLSPEQAQSAFEQSLTHLARMLSTGRVHGDYSTFNLLWWQERIVVIDFPQVVLLSENPSADAIFERDVRGLCRTFKHHGIRAEPGSVLERVRAMARAFREQHLNF